MIPRGEVGLILAGIGRGLRILDAATFPAAVIMVIVTAIITPPLLKLTLSRGDKQTGNA
jgi:Kef-type K+ transport system membrane component KefB